MATNGANSCAVALKKSSVRRSDDGDEARAAQSRAGHRLVRAVAPSDHLGNDLAPFSQMAHEMKVGSTGPLAPFRPLWAVVETRCDRPRLVRRGAPDSVGKPVSALELARMNSAPPGFDPTRDLPQGFAP